jgi:hypothetical protein
VNTNRFRRTGLIVLLLLLAACQPTAKPEAADEPTISSILVLPTMLAEQPKSGDQSEKSRQLASGAQFFNTVLGEYFTGKPTVRLLAEVPSENLTPEEAKSPATMARAFGQQLGGDAVLTVTLTRFTERHGNEYDVAHPASVAFELKLIAVATGKTLWVTSYDKTQEPLLNNLLSFKDALRRHFTWVTAEELARDGLLKTLSNCKYLEPQ